jgi:hypothetical protein
VVRARSRVVLVTAALACSGGIAVAAAQAVTPPAGTPDMSAMTVQPADLAPGARIGSEGYTQPPFGFTAAYERSFTGASLTGNGVTFDLRTQLLLAKTTAVAQRFVATERLLYGSKIWRAVFTKALSQSAGKQAALKPRDIHYGKLVPIAAGSGAFAQPLTVRVHGFTLSVDLVTVGTGRVAGELSVIAGASAVPLQVASALAGDIASRATSVLGATGATGTSGASGPTGTTGATGASGPTA